MVAEGAALLNQIRSALTMFNFLVTQSLRNRMFVVATAMVMVLCGAVTVIRLPVIVFLDLNRPTVTIMTEAEGLAPPEVEQLVTYPPETKVNGLPGAPGPGPLWAWACRLSMDGSTGTLTFTATASRLLKG